MRVKTPAIPTMRPKTVDFLLSGVTSRIATCWATPAGENLATNPA